MQVLNGFVKIHRKLIMWGWYQDNVIKSVFLHLLLTANYKETPWMGRTIKPGQVIVGIQKMADELGFTRQQVRRAITKLKSTNEITTETTNKFTIVTIENWGDYQSNEEITTNKTTSNSTNKEPTKNQQRTNKEPQLKNNKNIKNNKKERETRACAYETLSQNESEFIPPAVEEVRAYCKERGNSIDPERFVDYYTARDWYFGKSRISDWKAAVRSWEKTEKENEKPAVKKNAFNNFTQKPVDWEAVKRREKEDWLKKVKEAEQL